VRRGKRWFDALCALLGLILLSPLLLLVALAVKLASSGPILFRQIRIGQFGRPFRILKFRTMKDEKSGGASLLTASGDSRVTRLGRFLRKSKMDELPQLANVLFGQMSLVGPRPEVPLYVATYAARHRAVLDVRPGITGLSTHQFRNEEELLASQPDKESFYTTVILPTKLDMDLAYCQRITFWQDLRLIFATLAGIPRVQPENSEQEI
jgi:lipopolysaccharide/colanic/teichoic acid biosynthesis glycosyltransferase